MPAFVKFVNGKLYGGGRALSNDLGTTGTLQSGTSVPQDGQVIGGPPLILGNIATKTATSPGTAHAASSQSINTGNFNIPTGYKVQVKLMSRLDRGAVAQTVTVEFYNNTNAATVVGVTSASGTGATNVESAWADMPTPAALKEYHLVSYASAANAFSINTAYLLFRIVAV